MGPQGIRKPPPNHIKPTTGTRPGLCLALGSFLRNHSRIIPFMCDIMNKIGSTGYRDRINQSKLRGLYNNYLQMLKGLLLATLLITALTQITMPPAMAMAMDSMPSMAAMPSSASSPPSASMAMDTSTSDRASISSSSSSSSSGMTTMAMMSMSPGSSSGMTRSSSSSLTSGSSGSRLFYNTNNAWTYIQNIGGTCCNNCSKICGFGIKIHNTNYYLTNRGSYFTFDYTSNPGSNQIFTIGQNSDCTWYISNNGQYLSTYSPYGAYIGLRSSVGSAERWYIERSNGYVVVQSAYSIYNYWRYTSGPRYLSYSYGYSSRFTFEYIPCSKNYGWNW